MEPLSIPGRRLNDTPTQRHDIVYAPDTFLRVNVRNGGCRLDVDFLDDDADSLVDLVHGEIKKVFLRARNAGSATIEEVWMVGGEEVCIWIDEKGGEKVVSGIQSTLTIELGRNTLGDQHGRTHQNDYVFKFDLITRTEESQPVHFARWAILSRWRVCEHTHCPLFPTFRGIQFIASFYLSRECKARPSPD